MSASRRSGAMAAGAIALAIAFILTAAAEAATVTRGPYLQMGTQDRIVVRWRTDVATDSRVKYGLCFGDENCLIFEKVDQSLTTEHEVLLDGLAPNTRYYYAIGTTADMLEGNDSSHFFLTSPPLGLSTRTRIWVLGDSGTGNVNARQVRDAYYAHAGSDHTNLWLMLGDNAYNRGTDSEYQKAVFNTYPEMLRKSVLWPSFGNHDGASANAAAQSGPYFDNFTLPRNAEAGGVPSGTEAYYSFDHANIHFVVLDSFGSSRLPDGAMLSWLRADLQATRQDWIIAYWHHPPYSKGTHNSNTETPLKQMRQYALPILEDHGVDLVLAGHSHGYERSFLIDGHYGTSTTLVPSMILDAGDGRPGGSGGYLKPSRGPDPHRGTVYAVAGSSGKVGTGPLNHPAMFLSISVLGSLILDVDGNRLDATFLQSTGAIRDSFSILKGSPSNIEVAPNPHAYGSVVVGTDAVQTFDIRNWGTVDLQVTSSLFGDEANEFGIVQGDMPFTLAPGATHTIDVRFAPTSEGPKSTLLRLATDEPDQGPIHAALSGFGTLEPDIDVTLTALDYGEVLVATTSTQTFTVQNLGNADLQLDDSSLVGGDSSEFAIAEGGAPFTVPPGATQNIDVRFAPTTGGPKTTTLRLTSDDPDESPFDVILSGTATTAPEFEVSPTTHNYGVVWVGRDGFQTFVIRNSGSADLQILTSGLVGGDAAEFGVTQGSAPFTLAPGATYDLVVRFAPGSSGPKATTVRLTNDDQDESIVDLFVGGTAIMPPDVDVVATPDYGNVEIGTVGVESVIIRNLGGAELQVSGTNLVQGQAEEFAIAQGGAPFVVAPGQAHSVEMRFAPASRGPKATTLRVTSDDPDESAVDLVIQGNGLMPPDIDLAPATPDYGEVVVGTTASRPFVIRNLGDVELQVVPSLVSGDTGEFAIAQGTSPFTVMPGGSQSLEVRFIPTTGGVKTATLRLASDDQDEPTTDVAISGIGMMPPDIDLVPTPPDYGQVVVGTTTSKTFVIRNLGDVPLQASALIVDGDAAEFAVTQGSAPFTVLPGATYDVDVAFAPTSGGLKATTLRLTSDDADETTVEVALSGIGLTPADIDLGAATHDYGQVVVGTTTSQTIVIRNLGDVALHVSAVTFVTGEEAEFSITMGAAPFNIAPGATHFVDVLFAPGSAGPKTTTLRLVSDDQDEGTVDIVVIGRGMMPPDIDLAPVAHDYGQAIVGTTSSQVLVIGNLGDVDLHVTTSSLIGDESAEFLLNDPTAFTVAPGVTHSLEVRFVPTSGGPKGTILRLVSDDPNESTVDIPLSGVGIMPPEIDVGPSLHDYGEVLVGTTASRTFVIRNLGDVALQVTTTSLVGNDDSVFAIAQGHAPFTVAPGGTHNLDVSFAPTSGGSKTTTLRLTSDDSDESAVDLVLSGTATTAPEIAVVLTPIHYGEMLVGTTNARTFTIQNVGSADLHATASLVGGEAAEFAVTTVSFMVAPGETHIIDVTFVPTSGGPKATTLHLTSDDADEAGIDVTVSGIGMMPADIELTAMAHDYGEVLLGTTSSRTFTIRNLGDLNLHVNLASLVDGEAGEFAITQGHSPFTLAPGATHDLDVRFAPVSAGPKTTRLRLTSDDQDESVIDVLLSGIATTAPEFEVVTATANYGVVWVGAGASGTFVIRNVGSADLQVVTSSVSGSEAGEFAIVQGAAPITVAPGSTHNLTVRFEPAAVGPRTAMVRLTSNDQDEATVDLAVTGAGIMPPDIDATPSQHDYGEVVVGMTKSQMIAIRNSGGANLQVTAAMVVGGNTGEFAIAQGTAPFTVVAGATHNLEIRLAPTSEGVKTTTLRLASDDPDEGIFDVLLGGTGTILVPDIATQPESHDFGSRAVGTAVTQGFGVSNTGTKNLVVGIPTLAGADAESFTVVSGQAGFTIAPGATRLIEIRFNPATAGPKSATLTIPSDDPDENLVLIPLRGTTPPTFVEAAEGGSANESTVTTATSLSGVPGHLYLAAVSTKPYRQVSAITGMGLTWIRAAMQCSGRSQTGIELWWAQGAASSGQVTATLVSAPISAVIAVTRYAGVAPADPVVPLVTGNTNGVNGACENAIDTATYLFNVTTTQSNSLLVGTVALRNKTHTAGSGYTTRIETSYGIAGNTAGTAIVERPAAVATVLPLHGFLNGDVDWAIIGIELRSGP